ncbi:MAG: DUF1015 family protein [Dehalococcoidia bacterium]|nr:DUF1015 family protein [Dehalococcoidia bacterium]
MPDDVLRIAPIRRAWFSTDQATSAQNYDEFQHDSEVTEIIRANPKSILAVDMPQCHPTLSDKHLSLSEALPWASNWLTQMKQEGLFKLLADVMFIYEIEIKSRPARSQIGLGCMFSPADIWDASSNPRGKIIRNEEIFPEKAQGRADLIRAIDHIIGTVNLAAPDPQHEIEQLLHDITRRKGDPMVAGLDHKGNTHKVWAIDDPADTARLQDALRHEEVVVADGNHRSKASQLAGLDAFLGIVFAADTMHIDPYHRMIKDLGMAGSDFIEALRRSGFVVEQLSLSHPFISSTPNEVGLYLDGVWHRLIPQIVDPGDPIESLDAKIIENRVIKDVLVLDPADQRVSYVGGDYEPAYLQAQVDNGSQQCAFSLPAVTMQQFFRVNDARQAMPRKTTWFSPKIRSGFVIAEV